MKSKIFKLLVILVLVSSCIKESNNKPSSRENENSEKYSGPIIDMHIHAYTQNGGMFGLTHPPTLRGETFEGVKNINEHQKATIAKFREHNIVKAVVTNGHEWFKEIPGIVLIADSDEEPASLREKYDSGKLKAIAEMAPFYSGILADDPSQMPYFELAQELGIPVGFHIFPGGPNY